MHPLRLRARALHAHCAARLFACPTASAGCSLCALRAGLRCSAGACLAPLQAAQACFGTCLAGQVMLGSNAGRCMAAECGAAYAAVTACLDGPFADPGCAAELEACGVGFTAPD